MSKRTPKRLASSLASRYYQKMETCSAIVAVTIDGRIAVSSSHLSTQWTSKEDKEFLHEMLDQCDVVVIGNNTYKTAIEPLSKRNCIVFTSTVDSEKRVSDKLLYVNANNIDLGTLLSAYSNVAVLGGTQVYTYFHDHNLLTDIYLTVEPVIFGKGLPIFNSDDSKLSRYTLVGNRPLNETGTILLHYRAI